MKELHIPSVFFQQASDNRINIVYSYVVPNRTTLLAHRMRARGDLISARQVDDV
jgi:hypothetical protein